MLREEKVEIAQLFLLTAAYFGREIGVAVAQMYQRDVDDLPFLQVKQALVLMRRQPQRRTCPLPADIRALLEVKDDTASPEECAARIVGCIAKFGYARGAHARAHMGEIAWAACEEMGGYVSICQRLKASDIAAFTAQSRELCRMLINKKTKAELAQNSLADSTQQRLAALNLQKIGDC